MGAQSRTTSSTPFVSGDGLNSQDNRPASRFASPGSDISH